MTDQRDARPPREFDELVREHYREIFTHAFRLTGHHNDAEDLTHDTFVRAFGSHSRFDGANGHGDPVASERAWLRRIATNLHIDAARARSRRPTSSLTEAVVAQLRDVRPSPDELVIADELAPRLRSALDRLPDKMRWVVLLADMEGYTHDEVAAMLGVKVATVRTRLHRARAAMRADLGSPSALRPAFG
jgi:RNA polymerase sigma factor (sigma-70 family)